MLLGMPSRYPGRIPIIPDISVCCAAAPRLPRTPHDSRDDLISVLR